MKNSIVVVGGCTWGNIGLNYLLSSSYDIITVPTPMAFLQLVDKEDVNISTLCLRVDTIDSLSTCLAFMKKILLDQKASCKYNIVILTTLPKCPLWDLFYAMGISKVLSYHTPLNPLISALSISSHLEHSTLNSSLYTPSLSCRELTALSGWMEGQSINELANELNISPKTVYTYRVNATKKLGAMRTRELQLWIASLMRPESKVNASIDSTQYNPFSCK
ncbi:helix-turn-helix transcriptional regulator [Yersinia intermedia]|uniref:helix-turn-helix transcriptional regulator n=1 Tax=Yersinia intermedia TaxID=631 RepID=UPI0005DE8465|nr:LuxR C-terminal-related transcriptional regulator [Yersinia intermedia]CND48059.1 two component system sensor kinase SsrB [Yersinia intermedia]